MKFGSLFTGIGGFDLAFEQAGMTCAWQCEINAAARSVLTRHWPDVPVIEDVKNVGRHSTEPVDLICGGFPCQDLSIAGPRTGLAGERSGLWFEFHRIIECVRPRWVVVENVPGLLSSHRGRDFAVILRGLVECGYGVAWRVLDAQYFGVPQRRCRVFIVGSLGDGRAAQVLFERDGLPGHPSTRRAAQQEAAAALRADTPSHRDGGSSPPSDALIVSHLTFDWQTAGSARTSIVDAPGATRSLSASKTLAVANTLTAYHGRLDLDSTNYVSSGPGGGVRRLTPTECERLQGFPDGHTAGQSDSARYRQLGNAVAVPVARRIGTRIMEVLS
jgi:DNA (cytosine-5)-methyltransferase 1